ncbi:MAG: nuclear transport factor 2 family protein [Actinomycetes bacterium]
MTDRDHVVHLSRQVHDAWARSDVATLEGLIASDYHHVDVYGRVFDRAAWLAYAASPRSPGQLRTVDEEAAVIGGAAVVTSTLLLPGLAEAPVVRLTQVWRRTADGWRRSWYQATRVEHSPQG